MEQKFKLTIDGNTFVGDKATLALTYCSKRDIKLYILPNPNNNDLFSLWIGRKDTEGDRCYFIVDLKDSDKKGFEDYDLESGYRTFFECMLAQQDNQSYEIKEIESA